MHVPAGIPEPGVKLRGRGNHCLECVDETRDISGGVNGVVYSEVLRLHQAGVAGVTDVAVAIAESFRVYF